MYESHDDFFTAFRAGGLDPAAFDHRAHLRAAVCALVGRPFLEACIAVRDGLGRLAARAGKPALYHETLTVAMMSLVADALAADGEPALVRFDLERFIARQPELVSRTTVSRRYRPETFEGEAARRRFRLPDASVGQAR
jgi:hypothetical protein